MHNIEIDNNGSVKFRFWLRELPDVLSDELIEKEDCDQCVGDVDGIDEVKDAIKQQYPNADYYIIMTLSRVLNEGEWIRNFHDHIFWVAMIGSSVILSRIKAVS